MKRSSLPGPGLGGMLVLELANQRALLREAPLQVCNLVLAVVVDSFHICIPKGNGGVACVCVLNGCVFLLASFACCISSLAFPLSTSGHCSRNFVSIELRTGPKKFASPMK